LLALAGS
jgi:hypothetical protein